MWIGDVFSRERAEQIPLADLPTLFSPPPEVMDLEWHSNHIILGAKGSGKSTLLKALTYPVWLKRAGVDTRYAGARFLPGLKYLQPVATTRVPQFMGIYVPMRYEDASSFRTAYDEAHNHRLFEHFFVSNILHNLTVQWADLPELTGTIESVIGDYVRHGSRRRLKLAEIALAFHNDRMKCLEAAKNNPTAEPEQLGLAAARVFSMTTVYDLSARLTAQLSSSNLPGRDRLGLFIDSIDYYGTLTTLLLPLFESDSPSPVVIKAAARTLNIPDICAGSRSRPLELNRDFYIVTLDRLPDDKEYLTLMAETILRRIRTVGDEAFGQFDDETLIRMVFRGSEDNPDDLASFQSMCSLACGNILSLILLLDEAAGFQRRHAKYPPSVDDPIERTSRLAAIEAESRRFWDLEVGVRLPSQSVEAKALCNTLLEFDEQISGAVSLGSPIFHLPSIPEDERSLFVNLFATRVLILCDPELHRTLQAGLHYSGPLDFEINRLFLPIRKRVPRGGNRHELKWEDYREKYGKAVKLSKPHLSPKATLPQSQLFPPDFTVFVSLPFDRGKRARTTILRKAINNLYLRQTGRPGGPGISFVDIDYIPQVGPFRFDIPRYIADASYFVADISDAGIGPKASPGVFYEIGIAVGLLKPFALFFNEKATTGQLKKFTPSIVPELLRSQTIIIVKEETRNFSEEYRKVHQQLMGFNGRYDRPFGLPYSAGSEQVLIKRKYAYVSFQPRHRIAEEWCLHQLRSLFPDLGIERAREWQRGDGMYFYHLIHNATISIIDCTEGTNNACLELGMASSHDWKRVLLLFDSNAASNVNPVSMFPGSRLAWTDLGNDDTNVLCALLLDLAHSTDIGIQRS